MWSVFFSFLKARLPSLGLSTIFGGGWGPLAIVAALSLAIGFYAGNRWAEGGLAGERAEAIARALQERDRQEAENREIEQEYLALTEREAERLRNLIAEYRRDDKAKPSCDCRINPNRMRIINRALARTD